MENEYASVVYALVKYIGHRLEGLTAMSGGNFLDFSALGEGTCCRNTMVRLRTTRPT
jgi:hypothetical protein